MASKHTKHQITAVLLLFTAVCYVTATPMPTLTTAVNGTHANINTNTTAADENYNCPADCHCWIPPHVHKPFLHAKCSSIKGLKVQGPINTTLPIHSIDLSYLNLPRLAHSTIEKLHDLSSIDLSHNELHEVGHLGRRIKKLNLKHNRLTSAKIIKLPSHVQVLNLQHNDITYLPLELTRLAHLNTLELSHNEINCSCDTLEVRNWLQERNVFMENPVKCSYPAEVKGKSWLQVRQADICTKEKNGFYNDVDENELMMGDEPKHEGSIDAFEEQEEEEEDELGKDFLPIEKRAASSNTEQHSTHAVAEDPNEVEGSGDLSVKSQQLQQPVATETTDPELSVDAYDADDGSGSGDGILVTPHIHNSAVTNDDIGDKDTDNDPDNRPVTQPASEAAESTVNFRPLGIFAGNDTTPSEQPISEEGIVPVKFDQTYTAVITDAPITNNDDTVKQANILNENDENNATYYLLGVLGLIVIGLILFVGIKRCKNRGSIALDAENQRQTELLDMDKKHPGKPIGRNEHIPLIAEKSKADLAKPINGAGKNGYDAGDVKDGANQQPLLQGNGTNGTAGNDATQNGNLPQINEPTNETAPHEYYPITPRYPPPKSPRASKYAQYPQGEPNNNTTSDDAYLPSSPKSGRYSPVYSPETGRVKIKLSETPRPKTPMLVTRTKSNAGDIISTPVRTQDLAAPAAVHVSGAVNGQLVH